MQRLFLTLLELRLKAGDARLRSLDLLVRFADALLHLAHALGEGIGSGQKATAQSRGEVFRSADLLNHLVDAFKVLAQAIAANLNGEKIVVEKSTSPVQTAKQIKANIQRYAGLSGEGISTSSSDSNIEIVVNPEFMREGKAMDDLNNPDRIILGVESETAKECMLRIYQPLLDKMGSGAEKKVVVTDVNSAEIIKHASNAFLATKISFINMIANLCVRTNNRAS